MVRQRTHGEVQTLVTNGSLTSTPDLAILGDGARGHAVAGRLDHFARDEGKEHENEARHESDDRTGCEHHQTR